MPRIVLQSEVARRPTGIGQELLLIGPLVLVELGRVRVDRAEHNRRLDLVQGCEHRAVLVGPLRGDEIEVEPDRFGPHGVDGAQDLRVRVARDGGDDAAVERCGVEHDEDDARVLTSGAVGEQQRAPVRGPVLEAVELGADRRVEESERGKDGEDAHQ